MIKIAMHKAKVNVFKGANALFLEGEIYLGRMSKDGKSYVVKSEEGYWTPLIHYDWAKSGIKEFEEEFKNVGKPFYLDNYKELNK